MMSLAHLSHGWCRWMGVLHIDAAFHETNLRRRKPLFPVFLLLRTAVKVWGCGFSRSHPFVALGRRDVNVGLRLAAHAEARKACLFWAHHHPSICSPACGRSLASPRIAQRPLPTT